jgi:MFS family permease
VQHSHEALDRSGGLSRINLLAPLRDRDFRRLWSGMTISLVGDGAFLVALAWEVYALSNAPTALSLVSIAMTVPTIVLLLVGGAVSDRFDRRRVMIAADGVRALAVGLMALLAATGSLNLWEVGGLVALYGAGTAFFSPAFDAVVPDVLPPSLLAQANALDQLMRPIAFRLAGPAIGGVLIGTLGAGSAFALDALSFAASGAAVLSMRPLARGAREASTSMSREIREGFSFVRGHTWLWGTLLSAAFAYLAFMGPAEVLLPFVVKNELGGGATQLGLVFAAGGLGAVGCAILVGERGLPRRDITLMYACWTLATVMVCGYGLATAIWQLMLASFAFNVLETAGTIVWATAKQRHVPASLLGRVSSLDWLISIGLLPLSFALTGPLSDAVGVRATLLGAGMVGGVVTFGALFLPGMLDIEGAPPLRDDEPRPEPARQRAPLAA